MRLVRPLSLGKCGSNDTTAVPIFNIDKRPFALLCAYNASDHTKRYVSAFRVNSRVNFWVNISHETDLCNMQLEGHELSYLRAIGEIELRV